MHETFRSQILLNKDASGGNPVVLLGDTTYMYSRHSNVWILMVTNGNANAAAAFKFVNDVRCPRASARIQQPSPSHLD